MAENKRKILIVDDDDLTRETYVEVFKKENYEVIEARDGVEGLDLASKNIPDVIFTGIIMPRMDGFGMVESLKKTVLTANIPVVILSHMGREEDQQRAKQLGAKDFIIRDVTPPAQVLHRISALFESGSGVFQLDFSPYAFDASKLATEMGFKDGYQCQQCSQKIVLELKVVDINQKKFEAVFVCPKCAWVAK